jgi:hypothetical protein
MKTEMKIAPSHHQRKGEGLAAVMESAHDASGFGVQTKEG